MSIKTPKSLMEVVGMLQFIAPCPLCMEPGLEPGLGDTNANQMGPGKNGRHKRGRLEGQERSAMPVCRLCKGLCVVYLNRVCECGCPAVKYEAIQKVWHCGDRRCMEQAIWRMGLHTSNGQVTSQAWSGL